MLMFIANATDTVRKIKDYDKTLKIILPERLKLLMKFNRDEEPYIFKVKGFKIHQEYLDSVFPNNEYSIAIGFCKIKDWNVKIDDIDEFKKEYLTDMPKISETIIPNIGIELKIPYFSYDEGEECILEEHTKIEKLMQSNTETGVMMFKTAGKSSFQSGGPIIANLDDENEIIGMCLHKLMGGVGAGVILTGKLRKWYYDTVKEFVMKCTGHDNEEDS